MRKIKILFVVNVLERTAMYNFLLDIIKNLEKNKYEVMIFSIEKIGKEHLIVVKDFSDLGVRVNYTETKRKISFLTLLKFNRVIKEFKPDIVHSNLGRATIFSRLFKIKHKFKLVDTIHNLKCAFNPLTRIAMHLTSNIPDFTVYVSKSSQISFEKKAFDLKEALKSNKKSCFIYNPIDLNKRKIKNKISRAELNLKKDDVIFIDVARLVKQKGHFNLLKAFKEAIKENNKLKLLIVGEGSLYSKINKFIIDNNLSSHIFCMGFRRDVFSLLEVSDVFICPSVYEGLPLAFLEAMLFGLPIISTNIGPVKEVVTHEKNGLLSDINDTKALKNNILLISRDKKLRKKLGMHSSLIVKKKFSAKKIAREYSSLYNFLVRK
ncbi:MAG: glycosyltransferase [Candidatus Woesearchaeota archaeon]